MPVWCDIVCRKMIRIIMGHICSEAMTLSIYRVVKAKLIHVVSCRGNSKSRKNSEWVMAIFSTPYRIKRGNCNWFNLSKLRGNLIDMKNRYFQDSVDSYFNLNKIEINSIHPRKQEYLILKCRNRAEESNDIYNNCRNSRCEL